MIWLLFRLSKQSRQRQVGQHLVLISFGLISAGLSGELILRLIPPFTHYAILPANLQWEFKGTPDIMPGVSGRALYTTNQDGIRGTPYQANGRYNILAIGGSTTETSILDNTEAWTYLLQAQLNQDQPTVPIWIGNVGRSGHGLVEHIHALQHFTPQYQLDAVIMLVGINDLGPILWQPDQYTDTYESPQDYPRYLHRSFYTRPLIDTAVPRPFPQNLALWNLIEHLFWRRLNPIPHQLLIEDETGLNYVLRRQNLRQAPLITTLPDLTSALRQYRQNLRTAIHLARQQNVRLILVTQPVVWHEEISPQMIDLLWFGHRGELENPNGRYAIPDLLWAITQFNQTLLDVCGRTQTECVDLAFVMNGHEPYFYDDVHFNEAGARAVADHLANYLQKP